MKKLVLIAALAAGVAVLPTAANADPGQTTVKRTTVTRTSETHRRVDNGRRWHWKTVCTTKWKHGRKWRQCRKVRTRW
jgi:hypothetical protein